MPDNDFQFEDFAPHHLDGALKLSRQAGWPHRRDDWALLLELSRGVVVTMADQVIATALATPFGPVGMTNMIIVDQDFRGRGLGRAVMERSMAMITAAERRLTATQDGLPLYEKLGFVAVGQIVQHQGLVQATGAPPEGVRWATAADLPAIARIDAAGSGMPRDRLLERLAEVGRFVVVESHGAITGYVALRDFGRGELAGPMVADSQAAAEDLLRFLFCQCKGRFLRVDTTPEAGITGVLDAHGLTRIADGIAMRRGSAASVVPPYRIFALAAQALG